VQREEISLFKQFVQGVDYFDVRRGGQGRIRVWVKGNEVHAETSRSSCNCQADCSPR